MKSSLKIALIYLIISFFWILFSDMFVNSLTMDADKLTHIQTYKGWFFISATAILLFLLINNELKKKNKVQDELEKAKLQAEESDRLKTAFLSNMSHEIRTPLNGIIGFSSLLNDEDIPAESKKMYIEQIEKNGQLLIKIINDIIEISRIQKNMVSINLKLFDLNKELDNLVKRYTSIESPLTRKGLELIVENDIYTKPFNLFSDPDRIDQILMNLINNAIKFTNKGTITIGYTNNEDIVRIFVEDTGSGIDIEDIESIFQRFNQNSSLKDSNDGVGLGLAISKGLAEALDGKIEVESETGKGSRFTLILPFYKSKIDTI